MVTRNLVPVLIGIMVLSCMFLIGQDAWPPQPECDSAEDCDDLNPCTNEECSNSTCVYTNNTDPCDDSDACTGGDRCSGGTCSGDPLDQDDDTYVSDGCGGNDCDDSNGEVYPGAPELCDGIDNQCPGDPGYEDVDEGCDMVQIPAGCFSMGDPFSEGDSDELPVHSVCITAFEMDVHEVTNAEYAACVDEGVCTLPSSLSSYSRATYYGEPAYEDFPVIYVGWYQAQEYCTWAGKRLPSEAEWEYAARGGLDGQRYPWEDKDPPITGSDANYWGSGDPWDDDTSQVEYYAANGYGLYDMAGNVYEWVNDWYQSDYYSTSPSDDPPGPTSATYRVFRGGSWNFNTTYQRVADRGYNAPGVKVNRIGLRCARGGAFGP